MASRRELARRLERIEPFDAPSARLEQYVTTPEVAASLVHEADLRGDLDRRVIDLGAGTGMLAIAAALRGASVVALERDPDAVAVGIANARRLGVTVDWILGDVTACPIDAHGATVVMNPPFGAQRTSRGADRPFLDAASRLARVSYAIHNADSRGFVEAFAAERGGHITDAYAVELDLPRQFAFHDESVASIDAEAYRIAWTG